jgi:hypothetical protein
MVPSEDAARDCDNWLAAYDRRSGHRSQESSSLDCAENSLSTRAAMVGRLPGFTAEHSFIVLLSWLLFFCYHKPTIGSQMEYSPQAGQKEN